MRSNVAKGYVPELDGLRALAILPVMIFHASPRSLPGGFLGVEVFFVLSGFLITTMLLAEFDRFGQIDFRNFYLRRALRLFPALVVMVGLVSIAGQFILEPGLARWMLKDGCLVFTYAYNWVRAFELRGDGYFCHSWSLSIEEQFYFLWPPLFAWGLTKCKSRESLARQVLLLAVIGAAWRAVEIGQGAGLYRVYNGLDTRMDGVLLGCAAAIMFSVKRPSETHHRSSCLALILTIAALAIYAEVEVNVSVFELSAYIWALPLTACATLLLLRDIDTHERENCGVRRLLASPILVWVGQRSYGLYLWHYPIVRICHDCELSLTDTLLLGFGLSTLLAELSYQFVERPFLKRFKHRLQPRAVASKTPAIAPLPT